MTERKNVALIIETSNAYARGILHGLRDFIRDERGWSIYLAEHGRHEVDASFPPDWDGDGVIARIETEAIADIVRRMKVPTVDVSAARLMRGIPWVETDDAAITELAVDHLIGCGLRNLAFFGDPAYNWSRWRCHYFRKLAQRMGFAPHIFNLPNRTQSQVNWYKERDRIFSWLKDLPKPIGIFAGYDACAQQLLEICRYHDLSVPDEVAVVGVDNDELLCDLAYPSLTSVIPNTRQTGYIAASLLKRMMAGEAFTEEKISIKPLGIEKRMSTDIVAVEDRHVSAAVAFIRENAHRNIGVEDVLKRIPLSRRVFETSF
ncbi:MAG: XylR family transcriptional regulator [Treponemataceae bacterium]